LDTSKVVKVCRYVDDFLIFLDTDYTCFKTLATEVIACFKNCMEPLEITFELPLEESLRFLDLRLEVLTRHVCWAYEPRGNKPLLPFHSAHSKLVKRGVVRMCLKNSITKSCKHTIQKSFNGQVARLKSAEYPESLLTSVVERLLKEIKQGDGVNREPRDRTGRPVVVPYMHKFSHNLKRAANRVHVDVVFSAPNKLYSMCKKVNSPSSNTVGCTKKHRTNFVSCVEGVIYSFPLSCGGVYIGQTGRCLNDRLREHHNNVLNTNSGHLGIHCRDCGCSALLNNCTVLGRSPNQLTREIIEAANIDRRSDRCVSRPSITLSQRELEYLSKRSPMQR
ncbi:unnamed protein product, partial [Ixodes hexagonus]